MPSTSVRPKVAKAVQGRKGKRRFARGGQKPVQKPTLGSLLSKMAGSNYS